MPQTLDEEWRKYLRAESTDINLERFKNSIGNLFLISGVANSSMGQDPFETKKSVYSDISGLTRDLKSRTVLKTFLKKHQMFGVGSKSKFTHYAKIILTCYNETRAAANIILC